MRHSAASFGAVATATAASTVWAVISTSIVFEGRAPNGAHFANGVNPPSCSVAGNTVTCTSSQINGVGNTDATLILSANSALTVRCRNHGGKIVDVKTQVKTDTDLDDHTDVKNGNLRIAAFSIAGPTTDQLVALAVCPNPNWTKVPLGDAVVTSFTYTLTFDGFTAPAVTITGP